MGDGCGEPGEGCVGGGDEGVERFGVGGEGEHCLAVWLLFCGCGGCWMIMMMMGWLL